MGQSQFQSELFQGSGDEVAAAVGIGLETQILHHPRRGRRQRPDLQQGAQIPDLATQEGDKPEHRLRLRRKPRQQILLA